MVEDLCSCDWGLGLPLPWHAHRHRVHVRRLADGFEMTCIGFVPQDGWAVLEEWDDLDISVDWKRVARELVAR